MNSKTDLVDSSIKGKRKNYNFVTYSRPYLNIFPTWLSPDYFHLSVFNSILFFSLIYFFLADWFNDFFGNSSIANNADDATPYTYAENIPVVILELKPLAFWLFKWFENNRMKANPEKCRILLSDKKSVKSEHEQTEIPQCYL